MSNMSFGSDGFLYSFNNVTKLMEGFNVTNGTLESSYTSTLGSTNLVNDGTLILGHNPLSNECEGYDIAGVLQENFAVDWTEGTPLALNELETIIYGYNALTSEIKGYTIATGVIASTAVVNWNPINSL
jgi:hypothetical protein